MNSYEGRFPRPEVQPFHQICSAVRKIYLLCIQQWPAHASGQASWSTPLTQQHQPQLLSNALLADLLPKRLAHLQSSTLSDILECLAISYQGALHFSS